MLKELFLTIGNLMCSWKECLHDLMKCFGFGVEILQEKKICAVKWKWGLLLKFVIFALIFLMCLSVGI